MQTRKRQLGSKIDREVNTELLDAKIKYSQNKILPTCNQKLASRSGYSKDAISLA